MGTHKSKYGKWTCVCDFNETNGTNRTFWKDREHWGNKTDVEHEGNMRWGSDDEREEAEQFNKTKATNRSIWKNWTACKEEKDDEDWDEDEDEEASDKRRKIKCCMCGSVPGHWELIGRHGRDSEHWDEDDKEEHESSHRERWGKGYEKEYTKSHSDEKGSKQFDKGAKQKHKGSHGAGKDVDIGLVLGLFAGGILAGSIVMAAICFAYQRKRKWITAPQAVGTATVVGRQVPTAHKTSKADADVVADLECGGGNRPAI